MKFRVSKKGRGGYQGWSVDKYGHGNSSMKKLAETIARGRSIEIEWSDEMELEEQEEFLNRMRKHVDKIKELWG